MGTSSGSGCAPPLTRRAFVGGTTAIGLIPFVDSLAAARSWTASDSRDLMWDADWHFFRGDAEGAEQVHYDSVGWRRVDLPHDWSIEDRPDAPAATGDWQAPGALWSESARRPTNPDESLVLPVVPSSKDGGPPNKVGPFDAVASEGAWTTGWTVGGVGWYRKRLPQIALEAGEKLAIRFDGVYQTAEIWFNGVLLGKNDHGHCEFEFDLTPYMQATENIVAVRVRNEGLNSRWYNGSGIYRHVWLTRTAAVRVPMWGVFVKPTEILPNAARISIAVQVENTGIAKESITVDVILKNSARRIVGTASMSVSAGAAQSQQVALDCAIDAPDLWSPADPLLYAAEVSLSVRGVTTDRVVTPFGIRTISANARDGLLINGVPVKLKGACIHHDHGLLGAAAYDRAEVRKIQLLKANGFNAVRCSHNLYAPAFYDACDQLGMFVIDETFDVWNKGKIKQDLGSTRFKTRWRDDVANMVRRGRNHPSIIMWSIGNEIPERNTPLGVETAAKLRDAVLALDTTRPITAALSPSASGPAAEPSRRSLDIVGYNYLTHAYEQDHADNPDLVFLGTEQFSRDIHDAWRKVEKYPWLIGDFVWTAIDYVGEVGTGSSQLRRNGEKPPPSKVPYSAYLWDYPFYQSGCGEIDIIGTKKPQSYYRDVLWNSSQLELFVQRPAPDGFHEELGSWAFHDELMSWTWASGDRLTVRAYTNGDEIRLLLNGEEVGRKPVARADKLIGEFVVPYRPGKLIAVAYREGVEIARKALETVGKPARLKLRAERTSMASTHGELAYFYAEVCDAAGRHVPDAQLRLEFAVHGPASILATGSANPRGLESFKDPNCTTFHGLAQAILIAKGVSGHATLSVTADGLLGDRASITLSDN